MHLHCPHCDNTINQIPGTEVENLVCPFCGSTFSNDQTATTGWLPREAPKRLGKFELLERLGVGAFGAVYKARDTELNRTVAIKIPRQGSITEAEDLERFLREAKSTAQLKHPGIVSVYDASQRDGILFLVSEYIHGATLAETLSAKRFAFRDSAELIVEVAEALHYAHQRGVVHRDLKPSNIMLDLDGRPHLMDFGLAKWALDDSLLTVEGQIVGTPAYMSPEQARGEIRRVDARSDIYSLGVILYQLLTNELPFRGQSRMLLVQVAQDEPRAPHLLHERIPRDLETICLKAMAKEPARRYQSGRELTADLQRYLKGEPIHARPVGFVEKTWRWCRRNPLLATAYSLAAASLLAVAFVSAVLALRESRHASDLATALNRSEEHRVRAERRLAESFLDRGLTLCEQGKVNRGMLWLARSLEVAPKDNADLEHVIRTNLASWHDRLIPLRAAFQRPGAIASVVSPDARSVLVVHPDFKSQLWDAVTAKPIGEPVEHSGHIVASFSRDGRVLVTVERLTGAGKVWDAVSGRPIGLPLPAHGEVLAVVADPSGKQVFTLDADQMVRRWDVTTTKCSGEFGPHLGPPSMVAVSPDGRTLLTATRSAVQLWDLDTQQPRGEPLPHEFALVTAFSSDGQWVIAGGGDKKARVWSTVTGEAAGPSLVHTDVVQAVALSPDGHTAIVGGGDRAARLWNVATGQPIGPPLEHRNRIDTVAISPDGRTALTGSIDASAQLWDAATGRPIGPSLLHLNSVKQVAFSLDGSTLVTVTPDSELRIWNLKSPKTSVVTLAETGRMVEMNLCRDGQIVCTSSVREQGQGVVQLWQTSTGALIGEPLSHSAEIRAVAWSPDRRTVLTGCADKVARLWDATTGKPMGEGFLHSSPVRAVAFSPDGRTIATGCDGQTAQQWDVATGRPIGEPLRHERAVLAVAYRPDGRVLMTATAGGIAQWWDAASGRPLDSRAQHEDWILAIEFSPDGKRVATASDDLTARIWDAETGKPLAPPMTDTNAIEAVAFSPDGAMLLAGTSDHTARLWNVATDKPLSPPLPQGGIVLGVGFQPKGPTFSVGSDDGKIRSYDRPAPVAGSVEEVVGWLEMHTGLQLDADGAVRVLTAKDWNERRARRDGISLSR